MGNTTQSITERKAGKYRDTEATSAYLRDVWGIGRAPATLVTLRCRSGGPKFFKAGSSVLYEETDTDNWARELLGEAVSSTSEYPARQERGAGQEPPREPIAPDPRHALTRVPSPT